MSLYSRLFRRLSREVDSTERGITRTLRNSLRGETLPKAARAEKRVARTVEQQVGASTSRVSHSATRSAVPDSAAVQQSKPLVNRFVRNTAGYATGAAAIGATAFGLTTIGGRSIGGAISDVGSGIGAFRDDVQGDISDITRNVSPEDAENYSKLYDSAAGLQAAQNEGVQDTLTGAAVGGGGVLLLIGAGTGLYLLSQKGKKKSGKPKK